MRPRPDEESGGPSPLRHGDVIVESSLHEDVVPAGHDQARRRDGVVSTGDARVIRRLRTGTSNSISTSVTTVSFEINKAW
jgi:hypothetical protein